MSGLDEYKEKLLTYINKMYSMDSNQGYRAGFNDALFELKDAIVEDKI